MGLNQGRDAVAAWVKDYRAGRAEGRNSPQTALGHARVGGDALAREDDVGLVPGRLGVGLGERCLPLAEEAFAEQLTGEHRAKVIGERLLRGVGQVLQLELEPRGQEELEVFGGLAQVAGVDLAGCRPFFGGAAPGGSHDLDLLHLHEPRARSTLQMRELHPTEHVLKENPAQHGRTARVVLVAKHIDGSDQLFGQLELDRRRIGAEVLRLERAGTDLADVAHEAGATGCVGPHDDVLLV